VVFDTDEEIMAYHGPLLFPARILEKTERAGGAGGSKVRLYRVHYDGWSSHWDEWVPESRLLKDDASARQLQKERIREFNRAFKKHKRSGTDGAGAAGEPPAADGAAPGEGGAAAANKRPRGGVVPADDSIAAEVREQLRLPQGLKLKLIEDWERVSREKALVPLPRSPSVHELLSEFVAAKAKRSSHERLYTEVCDGLRSYFNQALGAILLYKFERRQLQQLRSEKPDVPLVELYGAEHLLRLVVKLPELLAHAKLQREHMTVLVAKLMELLKFLQAHKAKYFADEYMQPDEDYLLWWASE